jgi:hypothetical protein
LIYLDTSVALAHLLGENRCPPPSLWDKELVSSRLFEYEIWTRIHARGLTVTHSEAARQLLDLVAFVEMILPPYPNRPVM